MVHPRRGRGLLRPQRRGRRRARRRAARARLPAARCACSGCARTSSPGSRTARRWSCGCRPGSTPAAASSTGATTCGATATPRGPAARTSVEPARGVASRAAVRAPTAGQSAAARRRRHRNAIPLYDFPEPARRQPPASSACRCGFVAARAGRVRQRVRDRVVHGRAGGGGRGAIPLEFRLRHLKDPRARAVLETVAAKAGWRPGEKGDGTRGRGIGFARYKNGACYVAEIAEVEVGNEVAVKRAWAAIDAGLVINPDGIINQTEGGIIQTVSWALKEAVQYDRSRITYPVVGGLSDSQLRGSPPGGGDDNQPAGAPAARRRRGSPGTHGVGHRQRHL